MNPRSNMCIPYSGKLLQEKHSSVFSIKFRHAPPTYTVDLAFRDSSLNEILTSY